jgi:hypothetical protein
VLVANVEETADFADNTSKITIGCQGNVFDAADFI